MSNDTKDFIDSVRREVEGDHEAHAKGVFQAFEKLDEQTRERYTRNFMRHVAGQLLFGINEADMTNEDVDNKLGWTVGRCEDCLTNMIRDNWDDKLVFSIREIAEVAYISNCQIRFTVSLNA